MNYYECHLKPQLTATPTVDGKTLEIGWGGFQASLNQQLQAYLQQMTQAERAPLLRDGEDWTIIITLDRIEVVPFKPVPAPAFAARYERQTGLKELVYGESSRQVQAAGEVKT